VKLQVILVDLAHGWEWVNGVLEILNVLDVLLDLVVDSMDLDLYFLLELVLQVLYESIK
jgi:hypothetical protein